MKSGRLFQTVGPATAKVHATRPSYGHRAVGRHVQVEAKEFLGTARSVRPLDVEDEVYMDELVRRLQRYYSWRGINVRQLCREYDEHNIGVIHESQFYRALPRPLSVDEEDVTLLVSPPRCYLAAMPREDWGVGVRGRFEPFFASRGTRGVIHESQFYLALPRPLSVDEEDVTLLVSPPCSYLAAIPREDWGVGS